MRVFTNKFCSLFYRRMSSFSFDNVRRASRNSIGYLGDMTKKLATSLAAPSTIHDDKEQDSSFKSDGASDDDDGAGAAAGAVAAASVTAASAAAIAESGDVNSDAGTDADARSVSSSSGRGSGRSNASVSSSLLLQQVGKIVKKGSDVGKAVQFMARIHLSKELGYVTVSAETPGLCKGRGTLGAQLCTVKELKQRLFKQIEKRYPQGEEVSPRQRGYSAEQTNQASRLVREGFRAYSLRHPNSDQWLQNDLLPLDQYWTAPEAIVTTRHLEQDHHRKKSSGSDAASDVGSENRSTSTGAASSGGSSDLSPGILQLILGDARDMPVPLVSVRILRGYKAKDMWENEYTAYIIQCGNGKLEWEVTRRYHDFTDMESKIRSSDPYPFKYRSRDIDIPLPPLPSTMVSPG